MDTRSFDDLTRALSAVVPRRGVTAALTGGLLTTLSLARGEGHAEAKNKKRRKRKRKKKAAPVPPTACVPNCDGRTCGDDGCGGSCGGCGTNQACQGGTCVCACPADQVCLDNGSCATVCDELADCADGCSCNGANTEGTKLCAAPGFGCESIPQVCTGTAECPPGQTCTATGCGDGGSVENRCVPLCAG